MAERPTLVWLRDDLRLADNPALHAAAASGRPLLCLYVLDETPQARPLGGAARWWLHGALASLDEALSRHGGRLVLMRGAAAGCVEALAGATDAGAVYWNRRYDAASRATDTAVKAALKQRGLTVESFNGHLLYEPWTVLGKTGGPLRVFTPYWRAASALGAPPSPLPVPERPVFHAEPVPSLTLAELNLRPAMPDWAGGLRDTWQPGEAAAKTCLAYFVKTGLARYADDRDRPDLGITSRLSPYLRFGHISARTLWHAATDAAQERVPAKALEKFHAELGWREFGYHLLYHLPDLATRNVQPRFDAMPWRDDTAALAAWRRGRTGYPLVDAGMRQLWATGWMHNRVRMVAASFLVKHLLIDWRQGEEWFWDTLVDADPASNAASWQWVAGTGADAAPYFRIFNPTLQGEKFDPAGDYVRRWVPELASLPGALIHRPWTAPALLQTRYPAPIVDHDVGRRRALLGLKSLGEG